MDTWKARMGRLTRDTEGAVAIITVFILVALLGAASLAIDMGQIYIVRNGLQNSADAAALAAAGNLINPQTGWRDANVAQQTALSVAQRQSQLFGLPAAAPGERNDLTITFGEWNLKASDPQTAWTEIGPTCGATSNANAIRVRLCRDCGTIYGPVSNLFAGILGASTSKVEATAIAYIGFTNSVTTGTVQVPLALPSTILAASNGRSGWFADLFGPCEAVASTTKTYVFKDTGGSYVNYAVNNNPTLDSNQAYLFTVKSTDKVPASLKAILKRVYTPTYTSGDPNIPVVVTDLQVGQTITARSEFKYGTSYIAPIFQELQKAYNAKQGTYDDQLKYQNPSGMWRTTLVVYGMKSVAFQPRKAGFMSLARLLAPFWPSEAHACYTVPPPSPEVKCFVNADIAGVTYSASGNDGNYTYPKTINGITYTDKKTFLRDYPSSVWNVNSVTIKNVTDASTVSPPGSLAGGPSYKEINPGAPANVGALATVARLVK